ncbi:MAG: dihydrodipicolinate synthase family protein [Kiritimatiellae bacterium]|jgi:4-hydroxy-tetrahydrodipicolinate synthase|nr:dihydrodipicolinate synthase family protein [Kiritimatiellia bacterium]
MMEETLRGIVPPMITPLKDNETLDVEGLERLVEHILAGHVHGLFLLGTTGEAPDLNYNLRHELVKRVCKQVDGRVPVLVGITDTVFSESLNLAQTSVEAGVSAVVAAPPYYFTPGQPELIDYYSHLANRLPLPLYLYNMPSHTKVMIDPETVQKLSENDNIAGVKDSSANIVYFNKLRHLLRDRPDFSVLIGPEEALGNVVLMGAHGGVAGGANLFPQLFVDVYDAAVAGDVAQVMKLQERVMSVSEALYGVGRHMSSFIKGVKCSLAQMGICSDVMAEPLNHFCDDERALIHGRLLELGVELSVSSRQSPVDRVQSTESSRQ